MWSKKLGKVGLFSILYFDNEKDFEIETRKRIYEHIIKSPGLHLREIQRQLQIPLTVCEYHLNYLIEKQLLNAKDDKYFRRYYPANFSAKEKEIIACLRQENPRKIVLFLLQNENTFHRDIVQSLRLPPSTVSFYLNYLAEHSVISKIRFGRETKYIIADKDIVIKMLIAYRQSFLDKLVDRFLEVWFEK